jgi:glycosyltransferase involved in cell wall biosynthesis
MAVTRCVAVVNRGSIRLGPGHPFSSPLPGSEVTALNLARELSNLGYAVSYYGSATADAHFGAVALKPVTELHRVTDSPDLCLIWLRDYFVPLELFEKFSHARHILLGEDSVGDLMAFTHRSPSGLAAHLQSYLPRFEAVTFASKWHLRNWRDGFGLTMDNASVIYNLASHVPWTDIPPSGATGTVVHSSHPRKALAAVAAVARERRSTVTCLSDPRLYQDDSCRIVVPLGHDKWRDHGTFAQFTSANTACLSLAGPISVAQMSDFIGGFTILLHPDYSGETGATTVIEAIRRGLIPVVSNLGALPELVASAGIVVPGPSHTDEFARRCAAAVDRAATDGTAAFAAGRQNARQILDTGPILTRWLELITR